MIYLILVFLIFAAAQMAINAHRQRIINRKQAEQNNQQEEIQQQDIENKIAVASEKMAEEYQDQNPQLTIPKTGCKITADLLNKISYVALSKRSLDKSENR